MKIEVGSYEAKTKLPELLRGVQTGKRYTITLRGEAVADLVPPQGGQRSDAAAAAPIDVRFDTYNVGLAGSFVPNEVSRRPAFLAAVAAYDTDVLCLQALIEEGRA